MAVFIALSDAKIASLVDASTDRVAIAAPAIRMETAKALIRAVERLGCECVAVIVDCAEEVFRLGYGDFDVIHQLRDAGCRVRQSSGLRVGVLICDDRGWVFSPTALYVEREVHSDETPNAVTLAGPSVDQRHR